MLFQDQMGVRGVVCFIALLLLLITFAATGSEGKKRTKELFSGYQVDSASGDINEDMAEILWVNCRLELVHVKELVENFELYVTEEKSSSSNGIISKSRSLAKENIQKAISVLHPQLKQTLFDCLRKKNLLFLVSGEESRSENWYTKKLEFRFPRPDSPRQRELLLSSAETPAPSPAVGSPSFNPPPSSDSAPSSSQVPSPQRPAESPVQPFFPRDFNDSSSPPTAGDNSSASPTSTTNVQSNKKNSSQKSVVVAIGVTAAVSFVFATLLFLCYHKTCKTGSGVGRNDEKPLLSLSLSDYSGGSSQKPFSLGNGISKEKLGNHLFDTNANHNKWASSLDGTMSFGAVAGAANTSAEEGPIALKPPPGRLGTPSGLPPLKPPPGRADLSRVSSPEPPPLKPPPAKTASPTPPPPVPPSSLKPSGSPCPPPPGPPPPPPIPSGFKAGLRPPPPPKSGLAPPRPPAIGSKRPRPSPLGPNYLSSSYGEGGEADAPKAKLKPFFWDKVLANPDHSMVWHQIKSGSFQFNEEMIETLFGYAPDRNKNEARKESSSQDPSTQYIQIIDPKKAQNLSILLKALNVTTEEVCDALQEGNELPSELLQTLLKMAPTEEEELKLRLFSGELSRLGPAERFLKVLGDIPFAFKRMESLLFMCTLQEEGSIIKESFVTLEAACMELRKSRLFLKLLEAVLKMGNRMNDGTFRGSAQAFKLDTLLKLADVKGVDGKTTLLHFVVQEIIRSEGVRAARAARDTHSTSDIKSDDLIEDSSNDSEEKYRSLGLQVVSGLGGELQNVKKAAVLDADSLTGTVAKLGHALIKARDFLNSDMKNIEEENGFHRTLKNFVKNAEVDVMLLLEEEKRIMAVVKSTADYFHGNAGKDEGLRLFVIVRDFLIMLDKVCKQVKDAPRKPNQTSKREGSPNQTSKREGSPNRTSRREGSTVQPSSDTKQPPDPRQRLFPAIRDRRMDNSSSDDDTP